MTASDARSTYGQSTAQKPELPRMKVTVIPPVLAALRLPLTLVLDCFLDAVRIHEAERTTDNQAEGQQPTEQPIGDSAGENARRDPPVAFERSGGDCERHEPCGSRGRGRCPVSDARALVYAGVRDLGPGILTRLGRSCGVVHRLFLRTPGSLIATQPTIERALYSSDAGLAWTADSTPASVSSAGRAALLRRRSTK